MLGTADSSDDCVRFPQYRVSASRVPHTGWGLWQPVSSDPQRAGWLLCTADPLCCVPQLWLTAGSELSVFSGLLTWELHASGQNRGFTVIKGV